MPSLVFIGSAVRPAIVRIQTDKQTNRHNALYMLDGHFLYISMAIFRLNFHSRHVSTVVTRPHTVDCVDCTCYKIDRAGDNIDGMVDFVAGRFCRQSTGDKKSKSTLSLVCTRP